MFINLYRNNYKLTNMCAVLNISHRWIPKGTDMTNIKVAFIKEIENWINNYPRAMFDYRSSNDVLLNI